MRPVSVSPVSPPPPVPVRTGSEKEAPVAWVPGLIGSVAPATSVCRTTAPDWSSGERLTDWSSPPSEPNSKRSSS